jgi:hypothetical protein
VKFANRAKLAMELKLL